MKVRFFSAVFLFMGLGANGAAIAQIRRDPGDFYEDGRQQLEQEIERMNRQKNENPLRIEDKSDWQEVSLKSGSFSVLMPGSPQEFRDVLETAGGIFNLKGFVVEGDFGRFIVGYSDEGVELGKTASILGSVGDGLINRVGGEVVRYRVIDLASHPGRELRLQNSGEVMIFRLYLVGRRLYVLGVSTSRGKEGDSQVGKFFDSFRLLPREITIN